ncbi:hypothetical protein GCM10010967_24970 [Dyadobacter beijingensis]|uniref:DUF1440 domain-containing protein n=1 Tax=Dyadobacter beijingensis TaxID=365489 RepID=A0ABQ2HVY4_9BACT|nr:hypothetical protein [Dyadobacter beijingensis]GGM90903.1 hypothetical protein GCM10010967_24970 [Dyadobacter beijingensis]
MGAFKISRAGRNTILSATLVAGTLDILAAFLVYAVILEKTSPARILMSISSAVFGKAAYSGGTPMIVTGLLLHFVIAFIFTVFYYLIFPSLAFLRQRKLLSGILYGVFIWLVMNLGVLQIVFEGMPLPDPGAALLGMAILIVAVGIPISYIVSASGRR